MSLGEFFLMVTTGDFPIVILIKSQHFRGAVTGTDEYHYLDCSSESYYECLGRRFVNWNFEATNLWKERRVK